MSIAILRGDARELPLPDACVDLIVCSPPYWSLRSYSDNGEHYEGQIGSEESPAEWLAAMLDCTREWVRVLKPAGSIFVNLGDKYDSGTTTGRVNPGTVKDGQGQGWYQGTPRVSLGRPKSLLGLPWRYALACMDDLGLILRKDNIWHKTNPLPESVDDRCATRHEYLFHLAKQPRYFAAVDEIREAHTGGTHARRADGAMSPKESATVRAGHRNGFFPENTENPLGKLPGSVWEIPSQPLIVPERIAHGHCCGGKARPGCKRGLDHFAAFPLELPRRCILGWSPPAICLDCGEGRRPVAARSRETYFGAGRHRSGASQIRDGAAVTGWKQDEKWRTSASITGYACACTPFTDHPGATGRERDGQAYARETGRDAHPHGGVGVLPRTGPWREYHLDGWRPPPSRPAVVLDPFHGTGTTLLVADVLGRHAIGIDRSHDYCRLARWRTTDPGERARAMQVPKPPVIPDGQDALFDVDGGEVA